ncbi:thiopurine S-methyltransferase [Glaciecola petra]|uniref:Thiopurine S-methyltransferase n=1 Tax=Glaciecola petra TaxID=3075602 RepID=A0ABU2ZVZ8_9ALTE|nr:thiopurine S-methyltransferase [Aestuariibacter sp. P117]MDT0595597.1 thiopurine S-methyltransferase [Aestuariibacter sp. P117]
MNPEFWHKRWQKNEIGFHEKEGSALLKKYFHHLDMPENSKVFVPLCGKTRDIAWLLSHGIEVVAIELNQQAVEQLFVELGVTPDVSDQVDPESNLICYQAPYISVFVGDFFALTQTHLGQVNAVYDRAALVALPSDLRREYSQHLLKITANCQQLLICYDYAENLLNGPPFSVNEKEVLAHYQCPFSIKQLYYARIDGGFRGQEAVFEAVYLLAT